MVEVQHEVPSDKLGDGKPRYKIRNLKRILAALEKVAESPSAFMRACREVGLKPIYKPFWEDLPWCDIHLAIAPDILHQVLLGILKYLVRWLIQIYGATEIDARCRRMPQNYSARYFFHGISKLSRLTGREYDNIGRILLGLIIDLPLPSGLSPARLLCATRAILDFVNLAQYPVHSTKTLTMLEDAMQRFHANKSIFKDLGIRSNFNLPKLHFLTAHWRRAIEWLGTADNFDTQYSERRHIDDVKEAYRASNRKDEFRQMAVWLERKEKVQQHSKYIEWRRSGGPSFQRINPILAPPQVHSHVIMAKHPSVKGVSLETLIREYGATHFGAAFARFVVLQRDPHIRNRAQVERAVHSVILPFRSVAVYHKARFWIGDVEHFQPKANPLDVVYVRPERINKHGKPVPGRFDTVLVNMGTGSYLGVEGYCVARVRVIFSLSNLALAHLFPDQQKPPRHLAYVEWFTQFRSPEPHHALYKIKPDVREQERQVSIIPVRDIRRSVQLFPQFGPVAPRKWTSSDVLDQCPAFYVDSHLDRHTFVTVR
ncbi:hypothetical protein FOMPIDRAFT_1137017 [Fomitopsis schrenkii]|uniref:Uncharacterized protein n=1 Tax=Fomitopsis schrenkii TaxID=2126942 RepID=S8ETD2_FOMSC|nr:hypothetical protein FOMPIDRAFT_1137017 [Fomitopsis schrenkii]